MTEAPVDPRLLRRLAQLDRLGDLSDDFAQLVRVRAGKKLAAASTAIGMYLATHGDDARVEMIGSLERFLEFEHTWVLQDPPKLGFESTVAAEIAEAHGALRDHLRRLQDLSAFDPLAHDVAAGARYLLLQQSDRYATAAVSWR